MSTFTLVSLTIHQFKHWITPTTWTFGADNTLRGHNEQGKSTMADAIIWTLFGTTRTGSSVVDDWLPLADPSGLKAALTFQVDDHLYTLQRQRRDKTTTLTLNGKAITGQQLTLITGLRDHFVAAFDPSWWFTVVDSETTLRKFFSALLPAVDPLLVLPLLGEAARAFDGWSPEQLSQMDSQVKSLRQDAKAAKESVLRSEGALATLAAQRQPLPPLPVLDHTALSAAEAALAAFDAAPDAPPELLDLTSYREALYRARQGLAAQEPPDLERPDALLAEQERLASTPVAPPEDGGLVDAQSALQAALTALQTIEATPPQLPATLTPDEQQRFDALGAQVRNWDARRPAPLEATPPTCCPLCHQTLPQARQDAMRQEAEAQHIAWTTQWETLSAQWLAAQEAVVHRAAKLAAAFASQQQDYAALRHQAQAQVTAAEATYQTLRQRSETAWQQYRTDHAAREDALRAVHTALTALHARNADRRAAFVPEAIAQHLVQAEAALATAEATNATRLADQAARRDTARQQLLEAIQDAQTAYHAAETAYATVAQQHAADRDIAQHLTVMEQKHQAEQAVLTQLTETIAAGQRFLQAQAQLHTQPLLAALHDTTIQLFEIGKEESIIPTFRVRYRSVPWSALSLSQKLRCAVELAHAVSVLTGVDYPLFLDNAESVSRWESPATQTIWSVFVAHAPLTWTTDALPEVSA